MVNITNLNPDTDIGASAWLVELDEHRILLDAGMHPKREGRDALPLFGKAGETQRPGRHCDFALPSRPRRRAAGGVPAFSQGARADDGVELSASSSACCTIR